MKAMSSDTVHEAKARRSASMMSTGTEMLAPASSSGSSPSSRTNGTLAIRRRKRGPARGRYRIAHTAPEGAAKYTRSAVAATATTGTAAWRADVRKARRLGGSSSEATAQVSSSTRAISPRTRREAARRVLLQVDLVGAGRQRGAGLGPPAAHLRGEPSDAQERAGTPAAAKQPRRRSRGRGRRRSPSSTTQLSTEPPAQGTRRRGSGCVAPARRGVSASPPRRRRPARTGAGGRQGCPSKASRSEAGDDCT